MEDLKWMKHPQMNMTFMYTMSAWLVDTPTRGQVKMHFSIPDTELTLQREKVADETDKMKRK